MSAPVGRANDTVRRANLSAVLTLIHRDGPMSRSALARATGLNRSTIADLVADLAGAGLVGESPPQTRGIGRPSPVVAASPSVAVAAVNPEIDAITMTVVALDRSILARRVLRQRRIPRPAAAIRQIAAALDELSVQVDTKLLAVGAAVPGLVRRDGWVRLAPHLGWSGVPFAAELAAATGLPVNAANDAHLGALAEHSLGAGRAVRDLVYLNGGASGIGGGIITAGALLGGTHGYSGEIGHTLVAPGKKQCQCGAVGCLETEVSRAALLAAAGLGDTEADRLDAVVDAGPRPALAREIARQQRFLAVALHGVINVLGPELVMLGGFLGTLLDADPARFDELLAAESILADRPRLVRAGLGPDLLAFGAAELAFEPLLADPLSTAAGGGAR